MSILIQSFDPANTSLLDSRGVGTIVTNGINPKEQLVLYNSSLVCFKLTFADQTTDIIPPSWAKSFKKPNAIGTVYYQPIFTITAEPGAQPVSVCYGSIYEANEQIDDLNVPLQYIYNIGNSGGIPVTNNTLFNTGNNPGTTVVSIQPNDATSPTVTIDNSGNMTIYSDNAGILTLLLKLVAGATPAIQIGASTVTAEMLGNLLLDNNINLQWKDTGGTVHSIMLVSSLNNTILRAVSGTSGNKIELQDETGATQFSISDVSPEVIVTNKLSVTNMEFSPNNTFLDTSGATSVFRVGTSEPNSGDYLDMTTGGAVYVKSGSNSNSRIVWQSPNGTSKWSVSVHNGTVTACGSGTTISHGMGVTPTTLVGNPVVTQPGSATVGTANFNGTTFKATIGGGTSLIWYGITF